MRARESGDPRTIGRYRILARIGGGGMAIVYLGRSPTGRPAAIKRMHTEFATDPAYRERFRREVAAAVAAGGRYSPGVLDAGPDDGIPWLATEFLPSLSLRDAVRHGGALPAEVVWSLAAGIAEALGSIHRAGIVHLDLKPANVLLTADGPRVIDFGIAADAWASPGVAAGSRGFMAPEQLAGTGLGPASDVYAFGATLVYALTGAPPAAELPVLPEPLGTVVEACLRPDPAARPTVAQLTERLGAAPASGLPAWISAEIDYQASQAVNPPVAEEPDPRRLSRRALLLVAGACGMGGVAAALPFMVGDRAVPGSALPGPSTAAPRPAPASTTAPAPRTVEFFAFGRTTLKSLTTTINGRGVTVTDVPLPYRRIEEIPRFPQRSTWQIEYRFGAGEFSWKVLADNIEYGTGGGSSTKDDVTDHADGII